MNFYQCECLFLIFFIKSSLSIRGILFFNPIFWKPFALKPFLLVMIPSIFILDCARRNFKDLKPADSDPKKIIL